MPRRSIGKYNLIKLLGKGTYGKVYMAKHPVTGEQLALKVLKADKRALKEASSLRRLNHPHIIRVYDVDLQDDLLLISMELGEQSLRDKLGPPSNESPSLKSPTQHPDRRPLKLQNNGTP